MAEKVKIINDPLVCLAMHEVLKKGQRMLKNLNKLKLDKFISPWKLYFVFEKSLSEAQK